MIKSTIFGQHDQKTLDQFQKNLEHESCYGGVLCADGHVGYGCPIGGVVAYYDHINMHAIGVDIACGCEAVLLDVPASSFSTDDWKRIADDISKNIAFGIGTGPATPVDHEIFEDEWWKKQLISGIKDKARKQLGSVGGGNHFCNIMTDSDNRVWICVHFGSRGVGHSIAKHFMEMAGGKESIDANPVILKVDSELGLDYLDAVRLAGKFAFAGREIVTRYIANNIIKANILEDVHQNHNFAWPEVHDNKIVWVARKGATPLFPNDRVFVGGSMGGPSAILTALSGEQLTQSLYSTVHGAGRILSRTQAAGKTKWIKQPDGKKKPMRVTEGLINESQMRSSIAALNIELRGGGADEAPGVYRDLSQVLQYHKDSSTVEKWLYPKVVVMAGSNDFDPYKD